MNNLPEQVRVQNSTEILISSARLRLVQDEIHYLNETPYKVRLCISSPPMGGILLSMICGSGAFWLPEQMKLTQATMYRPRLMTCVSAAESAVQVDIAVLERDSMDTLVLVTGSQHIGSPEPLQNYIASTLDADVTILSEEKLFRDVLMEKHYRKSTWEKMLTPPWEKRGNVQFKA